MKCAYTINLEKRLVEMALRGDVTGPEAVESIQAFLNDAAFVPGFGVLCDRREVGEAPELPVVQMVVEHIRANADLFGTCRWAIVVDSLAAFGVGRMTSMLAEGTSVSMSVFTDMTAARRWLREVH